MKYSKLAQETVTTPEAAAKNRAEGVVRGVPDYLIVHKHSHRVLFVELKRTKSGVVSAHQLEWLAALGSKGRVAYGYQDARSIIEQWRKRCDNRTVQKR